MKAKAAIICELVLVPTQTELIVNLPNYSECNVRKAVGIPPDLSAVTRRCPLSSVPDPWKPSRIRRQVKYDHDSGPAYIVSLTDSDTLSITSSRSLAPTTLETHLITHDPPANPNIPAGTTCLPLHPDIPLASRDCSFRPRLPWPARSRPVEVAIKSVSALWPNVAGRYVKREKAGEDEGWETSW